MGSCHVKGLTIKTFAEDNLQKNSFWVQVSPPECKCHKLAVNFTATYNVSFHMGSLHKTRLISHVHQFTFLDWLSCHVKLIEMWLYRLDLPIILVWFTLWFYFLSIAPRIDYIHLSIALYSTCFVLNRYLHLSVLVLVGYSNLVSSLLTTNMVLLFVNLTSIQLVSLTLTGPLLLSYFPSEVDGKYPFELWPFWHIWCWTLVG